MTPKPVASTPEPVVVQETKPATVSAAMRKKGLVDAVTERSGVKRKFVKPAIEAALAEIGEAIAAGRDLNLPGLGKIKVQRSKKMSNGDVYITRIRRPLANTDAPAGDDPKDPLAEAAE
ncbi:HU family DNA-binding protein [Marimonas lutisalis]|uniref:HU family DNA-binding protein n=1 Tax=Marimonas lutisalis TaxID=2545756 RepID=UPI001F3F1378|nr:HU family DNA-binding protein [Marimonas lutisalis]